MLSFFPYVVVSFSLSFPFLSFSENCFSPFRQRLSVFFIFFFATFRRTTTVLCAACCLCHCSFINNNNPRCYEQPLPSQRGGLSSIHQGREYNIIKILKKREEWWDVMRCDEISPWRWRLMIMGRKNVSADSRWFHGRNSTYRYGESEPGECKYFLELPMVNSGIII